MGQVISQLGQLFIQSIPTIVFVIFLLVSLNYLFFKPLTQTLDARARATSGALVEARQQAERAEEKSGQYERAIQAARQEIYKQREEIRRKALSERDGKVQEARRRAESMVSDAQADLDRQAEVAKVELRAAVDSLATEITVSLFAPRAVGGDQGGLQA